MSDALCLYLRGAFGRSSYQAHHDIGGKRKEGAISNACSSERALAGVCRATLEAQPHSGNSDVIKRAQLRNTLQKLMSKGQVGSDLKGVNRSLIEKIETAVLSAVKN